MRPDIVILILIALCALSFLNRRRRVSDRRRDQQRFRDYNRQRNKTIKP
ncbi:hypothetical protein KHS38_12035 [Mucilaginibacter sp. Bleaf8]|nr:hypothetical protein [Mucilaginibacter sp. Bleaf8]MBS7565134.1 hypothetical protein [Mucilaginibacter sp. Bleaf8]